MILLQIEECVQVCIVRRTRATRDLVGGFRQTCDAVDGGDDGIVVDPTTIKGEGSTDERIELGASAEATGDVMGSENGAAQGARKLVHTRRGILKVLEGCEEQELVAQ